MPKSVPSVNQPDWGDPLNEHLNQLNHPVTGGFHRWFGEENRPWPNGATGQQSVDFGNGPQDMDLVEVDNFTGFNELTGIFERWNQASGTWVVMQPVEQNPTELTPGGTVELKGDNANNLDRYLYLENSSGDLGNFVSENDLIEITAANDGNKIKLYLVESVLSTNKVRVTFYNPEYESLSNGPTLQLNANGEGNRFSLQGGVTGFFAVGDAWRGIDTGNTVMEVLSGGTDYYGFGFSAIQGTRQVISKYTAPVGENNYRIFKSIIKYVDINEDVALSVDRFGGVRLGKTTLDYREDEDEDIAQDLITRTTSTITDGDLVTDAFTRHTKTYAVRTTANSSAYNVPGGHKFEYVRVPASDINTGENPDLNDLSLWNGDLEYSVAMDIYYGHRAGLNDGSTTVTSDHIYGLRIGADTRGGKINKITNLNIRPLIVDTANGAVAPDELWGVLERSNGGGRLGKNFLASNTQIGSVPSLLSNSQPAYSDVTDKLQVYGNVSINEVTQSGSGSGNAPGNLTVSGTVTANGTVLTSDARLKTKIEQLSGEQALATLAKLEAKSFAFKNDPEKTRYGVIAQEIATVLPELVGQNKEGYQTVNYTELIPFLIEAVKDQQSRIESLEADLAQLKK